MVTLVHQIEALMSARRLQPGDRLPAERALAAELGVSRSRLREAMRELISRGIVTTRQGGGTYVAEPGAGFIFERALRPLGGLVRLENGFWRDVMELRKTLDTDAAFFAAQRATEADKARLVAALEAVSGEGSSDPAVQAQADAAFHMAIAEASHNAVLRQVMAGLFELMRISIAESLKQLFRLPQTVEKLDRQHRAIVAAILAGEADKARMAVTDHLAFVEDGLRHIEEEVARSRRATLAHNTLLLEEAKP
ncbi:FCD domain-containing protein [Allorhizobium borbori]|uniref:Pyruvate dehydrogenase complex repressor n=1 Tax=Allorhizobium borbori TaxID=485907 RepID=A0A7W6K419_9HYPH|nr:FCD domain-containing protein [Allorhizobium borbori]MBB4103670.1 GntR family L-lactate dehydrogenase operon transcriptional regulator [Allorhizobium borbori]